MLSGNKETQLSPALEDESELPLPSQFKNSLCEEERKVFYEGPHQKGTLPSQMSNII